MNGGGATLRNGGMVAPPQDWAVEEYSRSFIVVKCGTI